MPYSIAVAWLWNTFVNALTPRSRLLLSFANSGQRWLRRLIPHMLDLSSRRAVSHSCRSLRTACQRAMHIRAVEYIDKQKPAMWNDVLALLARTDSVPVFATYLHDFAKPPNQAEQLYSQSFSRAHGLVLRPYGATVWNRTLPHSFSFHDLLYDEPIYVVSRPGERDWMTFSRLLRFPAPHLRTLQLRVHLPALDDLPAVAAVVPPDILARQPAALRNCLLYGVTLPFSGCPAFSSLTLLDYSPSGGVISPAETAEILKGLPSLVTLGLTLESFRGTPYRKVASHRSLKRVAVRYSRSCPDTTSNRRVILFFLRFALDDFLLDLREEAHASRSMYRLIPGLAWNTEKLPGISSVEKYLPSATEIAALDHCAVVTGSHYRLVVPMDSFRLHGDANLFANLQSLTISADHWMSSAQSLPPAPLVTSLRLVILPHHWGLWSWEMWRAVPGFPAEAPWACPALQTLEIAYVAPSKYGYAEHLTCLCDHAGTISLEDVSYFVRGGLRFDAARLRRLTLSGISAVVDPEPGRAFVALHEMADDLEILSSTSAHVRSLRTFLSKKRINRHSATSLFDPTFAEEHEESRPFHARMGFRDIAGLLYHW
ncbi:hypothetical protein AURDEDRAFT_114185 [Auricularia subglabra TFB-10046 SS5]|nr:hypothetical protein AURDEDRAFT_114185 [Auricularia subglabra TFB-10046 SS5]